jgi:hypothetical protein
LLTQFDLLLLHHSDNKVANRKEPTQKENKRFDIKWANSNERNDFNDKDTLYFFAEQPNKSFKCRIKQLIWKYLPYIILVVAIFGIVFNKIRTCKRQREASKVTRDFYNDIKESLVGA